MKTGPYIEGWLARNERTISWLAAKARISDGYLNRIIQGHHSPSIEKLRGLAVAMGIPFVQFLSDIDIIPPVDPGLCDADPDLVSIIQAIRDHPEKARAVAPLLKTILEEPNHSPGDIQDLLEALLALPENRRQGLLMALGK